MPTWSSSRFFWCCFVSLVKITNWFKFHVNTIPGSGVMSFFYKGILTKNLKIGTTSSEFSPIARDWGELGIPHLAGMSPLKCSWMLQNIRLQLLLLFFQLLREKKQGAGRGGGGWWEKITAPLRLTLTRSNWCIEILCRLCKTISKLW